MSPRRRVDPAPGSSFRAKSAVLSRSAALIGALSLTAAGRAAAPAEPFRHDRWDRLLKAHVTEEGWVDYDALEGKSAPELAAYLAELASADPAGLGGGREEMAFWINAYNALCIQTLIDRGPPASVPHARLFGANIFTEKKRKVAGAIRSLDAIEHEILRAKFKDPRIHAALVCGAESCPKLRREAYSAERLEKQLDDQVSSWLVREKDRKGRRKNRLDRETKVFHASKIFDWYGEDFGGPKGVLEFIARHSSEEDREFIRKNPVRLEFLEYDWTLNRKSPREM